MIGIQALNASVSLLLERGMEHIEKAVISNIQTLINLFEPLKGIHILSPTDPLQHGGIFTFEKQAADSQLLYQYLVSQGVVCAARGGGIRFSPHFYNSSAQLEQLASLVEQFDPSTIKD